MTIWDDLIKIIKDKHDIDFSISNFEKTFGVFKDNFITHFFVWNTIYMYVNLQAQNQHLLGTQLISRVIEKLNIILPKREGNFQIILKYGNLILNSFFAIPFYFMGEYNVFFQSY